METKVCSKCGRELPLEKFSKGSGKDGLQYACKDCVSAYSKEYAERKKAEDRACLEAENTEYDYGHDVKYNTEEEL